FLIIGGQGTYVLFESPVTDYNDRQKKFIADIYLTNLIGQPIGTNGAEITGIRVFFHTGPFATDGSGLPVTVNHDSLGTFTNVNQPYFGFPETFDETLAPNAKSAKRVWRFDLSSGATSFGFTVYVAADIAYPHGWVDVTPAAASIPAGTGSQQLNAAVFDMVGDPVSGRTLTWDSSNSSVASVDQTGLVTAGTTAGTALITATSDGPEATGTSVITVTGG
ncbi:MAG: Ig-like domain-containing protein, partial [Planctomycetota bacterium]